MKYAAAFLFPLLLLLPLTAPAAVIAGRVVRGGEPVAGVRVEAHAGLDFSSPPLVLAPPTAVDGSYRLELPAGRYALVARDEQRGLFAFCGRNPVSVGEGETVWAGLQAVATVAPSYRQGDDAMTGAVEGRVVAEGKPLADAVVTLYLDAGEDLKGQGYRISLPTGSDGLFAFDGLPESDYFLVVRRRAAGGRVGPVLEGDYFALYAGNPLPAYAGKIVTVELEAVRKVREVAGSETFARASGLALRGVVVDGAGRPVAGVHVFAYVDKVIGHKRPEAISPPTGADGVFTLAVPQPGRYYVGARQQYGDSPAPGELFGMYDAGADHGVEVAPGKLPAELRVTVDAVSLN
ncbi:MAG: hypothetical protein A2091_12575 [Desulfuromonadales bacterium GWD2_61_12]|nr:MAG: hypothetical protein A2091_12575 [Desulfuromonadales bacterium GWD2_61_12]HBT82938.1 hypothetical protein [Desulfuromonas sp.]